MSNRRTILGAIGCTLAGSALTFSVFTTKGEHKHLSSGLHSGCAPCTSVMATELIQEFARRGLVR